MYTYICLLFYSIDTAGISNSRDGRKIDRLTFVYKLIALSMSFPRDTDILRRGRGG